MNFLSIFKIFESFYTWIPIVIIVFGIIYFFQNCRKGIKLNWKSTFIRLGIIIAVISLIFFVITYFFKEESPFYEEKLIQDTKKSISKYDKIETFSNNLIDKWNQELKSQEEKLLKVQNLKDLTARQRSKVEKSLQEINERFQHLEFSKSELLFQKQIKNEELKILQEQKLEKMKRKAELEKRFNITTDEVLKQSLLKEIKELEKEINAINVQIIKKENEIGQINIQLIKIANDIDFNTKQKRKYEEEIERLDIKIENLNQQEMQVKDVILEIKAEIKNLEAIIRDCQEQKLALKELNNVLQTHVVNYDKYKATHSWEKTTLKLADKAINIIDAFKPLKDSIGTLTGFTKGTKLIKHATEATRIGNRALTVSQRFMTLIDYDGKPRMLSKESYELLVKGIKQDIENLDKELLGHQQKYEDYKQRIWNNDDIKNNINNLNNNKNQLGNDSILNKLQEYTNKESDNIVKIMNASSTKKIKTTELKVFQTEKEQLTSKVNALKTLLNQAENRLTQSERTEIQNKIIVFEQQQNDLLSRDIQERINAD